MRASSFRFGVEPLERRMLLSLSPAGAEFLVNSFTANSQTNNAIAADADGDFVVVWSGEGAGDTSGIFARRYNAAGVGQGAEFRVNTFTTGAQRNPAVSVDADGDFLILWESDGQDGSGLGVYARRYNAVGIAQGNEFRVNTTTANSQTLPSVAMDVGGDFVIAWSSAADIFAQRYNEIGQSQGGEFRVNSTTTGSQTFPSVGMDADGDFVVAWQSYGQDSSDSNGIYAQRYDAAGMARGGEFAVNTFTTGSQSFPSVGMDSSGDFVVAWQSADQDGSGSGVYAQRYDAAGAAQGLEFRVNATTAGAQGGVAVSQDADGDFLVAWNHTDGNGYGVFAQSFNAAGAAQGGEFRVNTYTTSDQSFAAVTLDREGDAIVAWRSTGQDGSLDGIYAQRYAESNPDTAAPVIGGVFVNDRRVLPYEVYAAPINQIVVSFSESLSTAGGASGANSVLNAANWQLTRNGVDLTALIDSISFGLNATTGAYEAELALGADFTNGNLMLIARETIRDAAGNALDGNLDGAAGGSGPLAFAVDAQGLRGDQFRVNTYTTSEQDQSSIAIDDAGNFVVAWHSSGQDGSGYGVYGQRYNAAGIPQGAEFRVNTFTTNDQKFPDVAMDPAGNFVVAWQTWFQDGSDFGIYARRYNSAGLPLGNEFRVNTTFGFNQLYPDVTMNARGDFVIAWGGVGQTGTGFGTYAQRFNDLGVPRGGEIVVDTYATFVAFQPPQPSIAMAEDGSFVVTWHEDLNPSVPPHPKNDIQARRYNAEGIAPSPPFTVNLITAIIQHSPQVAMDANGAFVITWESTAFGGTDVYARLFSTGSVPPEFRVNTSTRDGQGSASVAMDPDGDFVVAWQSSHEYHQFIEHIFVQRYDATGHTVGPETKIDTSAMFESQRRPSIALNASGDFTVSWQNSEDGDRNGVYARRYGLGATPVVSMLSDTPDPVSAGNSITLTASGVSDDQTVVSVRFHRESNGIAGLQFGAGGDALVGTDSNGSNGWAVAASTVGLSGGTYTYYAQAVDDEGFAGAPASTTNRIISGAPAVVASQFHFATLPQRLTFTFNQNVSASLALADIIVQTLPGGPVITPSGLTYDTATNTATVTLPGVLPDASYRATVLAAGISGPGGTMQTNHVLNFSFLRGDANGDGRVNLADFNALAANFGKEPRDFTQGDFNYDGRVNLADFNILAGRFGSSLPAALDARGGSPFGGMPVSEEDRDDLLEQLTGSAG